jgi:hypothetical protein
VSSDLAVWLWWIPNRRNREGMVIKRADTTSYEDEQNCVNLQAPSVKIGSLYSIL